MISVLMIIPTVAKVMQVNVIHDAMARQQGFGILERFEELSQEFPLAKC